MRNYLTIEKIKFSIILIVLCATLFLYLQYFIKGLNQKFLETKGILNMISMDLINKNENLKAGFTDGTLIKSLK